MKKFLQKLKQKAKIKKGFTLLETLVAVFILSLALTGPIYIASLAIRSSVESRDSISAYFLAEEVIEYIRNERDRNSLLGSSYDWLGGFLGLSLRSCLVQISEEPKKNCVLFRSSSNLYAISPCDGDCPPLSFNPEGNLTYGGFSFEPGNEPSKFTREFYMEERVAEQEIDVHVTVKWVDKGRDRQFKITERIHKQDYGQYYNQ